MVPVNTNYGDYTKIKILNRLKLKNTSIQGLEMKKETYKNQSWKNVNLQKLKWQKIIYRYQK